MIEAGRPAVYQGEFKQSVLKKLEQATSGWI